MQQRAVDASSVTGPDLWARDAFTRLGALPGVTRIGIALAEGGGRRLLFVASDRDNEPEVDWCTVDAYADIPLNTALRDGRIVAGSLGQLAARYPDFVSHQSGSETRAIAAVPITGAGQTLGGFVLFYARPQRFDRTQHDQLSAFGTQLGVHLRGAQQTRPRPRRSLAEEAVPGGARVATHEVEPDPAAVRDARRFLTSTLLEWSVGEEAVGTAELCLSELVTNSLIHTHAGCEIRLVLDDGVLTVSVRDTGSTAIEAQEPSDPLQVHGRGLQVVDALAARWGSDLDVVGTTVWFVLDI